MAGRANPNIEIRELLCCSEIRIAYSTQTCDHILYKQHLTNYIKKLHTLIVTYILNVGQLLYLIVFLCNVSVYYSTSLLHTTSHTHNHITQHPRSS